MLLYSWGVFFCSAGYLLNSSPSGGDGSFFGGFESKVWLVVIIQASRPHAVLLPPHLPLSFLWPHPLLRRACLAALTQPPVFLLYRRS